MALGRVEWTPARAKEAVEVIRAVGGLVEAAKILTQRWGVLVTYSSLKNGCYSQGIDFVALQKQSKLDRLQAARTEFTPNTMSAPPVDPPFFPEEPQVVPNPEFTDAVAGEPPEDPYTDHFDDLPSAPYRPVSSESVIRTMPVRLPEQPDPNAFPLPWQAYKVIGQPKETPKSVVFDGKPKRGIIIPDTHVPHQSRTAWACALAITKEWQPHWGVIIGDFMDLASLSRHPKSKPDLDRLATEYYETNLRLDELQERSPNCDWTYIEGNHEWRAVRYMNELGQLDGMLNVPVSLAIQPDPSGYKRFQTELRGMRWVSVDEQPYLTPHSAYYHGHHYTNMHHAASHANAFTTSRANGLPTFYGHMHSFQQFFSSNGSYAQCVGFLGDEKELGYTLGRPTPWAVGLILQEVTEDGQMGYTPVFIKNGRAVFHGKVVVGQVA